MARYPYIILDSYPLGNAALLQAAHGVTPTESQQCLQWMLDCEDAGIILLVPAIAYYEEVREMELRNAVAQIFRFQTFCFNRSRLISLTTEHLTHAAKLWAQVRRAGQPTADRHALDGDAILAAQVLSLGLRSGDYIVATKNAKHFSRFGLAADEWQNIEA